jgi:GTP-binding protein
MAIPVLAIVGRPNVGKSSLFNWLAGRRIAITDSSAGVTRDRLTALVPLDNRYFELVDTGGMGVEDADNLTAHVEHQIETAIEQAHVILFVVDARAGLTPLDEEVAKRLRYVTKPVICLANKCDTPEIDAQAAEFYKLGRGKLIYVSAQQNRGKEALLNLIRERLPKQEDPSPDSAAPLKIAIVGRRNTGKSTFINSLAEAERVIVSEVPGTTRDAVDVRFERDGKTFIAIDTAGVRKKGSISSDLEFYSMARAERSIRRADAVLIFIDPRLRISKVDKQLASYVLEEHKPAVFVVNKWDLMGSLPTSKFSNYVRALFPNLDYVPIAFITAKSGKNVQAVLNLAQHLYKQACMRANTGDLNKALEEAVEAQAPPMRQNRRPKIYYGTQVATNPPTIVLFTNGPSLFDNTYQRYLVKTFRDHLGFGDIPIKLFLRSKRREDGKGDEDEAVEEQDEEAAPASDKPQRAVPARPRSGKKDERGRGKSQPEVWKDV